MNNRIINILRDIQDRYGDMVFYNHQKTKNLIHDLAPGLHKERIHVGQFLELNGYFQLKYAGHSYSIIRTRLVRDYISTYSVRDSVAIWVLDVFSELLGYSDFKNLDQMIQHDQTQAPPSIPIIKPADLLPLVPKEAPVITVKHKHKTVSNMPLTGTKTQNFDLKTRISADMHSLAVTANGRVRAVGPGHDGQCDVDKWTGIKAVSAGAGFSVGLRENGRVVACGKNDFGQCNVAWWRDIIAVSAGARHTVGLKSDGTVLAAGQNRCGECNTQDWQDIVHVCAGYLCTFGIKSDYRVLVKGNISGANLSVKHLSNAADIVNPYPYRGLVLKRNGKLDVVGQDDILHNNVFKWSEVKQISAGPDYFAGLFEDGTVRILAYYWATSATSVENNPDGWNDIAAIAAGRFHLLGVKKDGSMVSVMMHPSRKMNKGQCRVKDWRLL